MTTNSLLGYVTLALGIIIVTHATLRTPDKKSFKETNPELVLPIQINNNNSGEDYFVSYSHSQGYGNCTVNLSNGVKNHNDMMIVTKWIYDHPVQTLNKANVQLQGVVILCVEKLPIQ